MSRDRKKVVALVKSWIGLNEGDGSYKKIIDIYNSQKGPFPRGTKMQYGWPWCACTWSALAIKLGYTDIMPVEISCPELIKKAKDMAIWVEKDSYIPKPGDAVIYDWDDSGKGDNTGNPDHVGTVVDVSSKTFIVVEGNFQNQVKTREMEINGRYIRGFITPKYDKEKKTPPKKQVKKVKASEPAELFNARKAGTYIVMKAAHCRMGAGTSKKSLCKIPKGTKVQCYGYYNKLKVDWLLVTYSNETTMYTGYVCTKKLKKG